MGKVQPNFSWQKYEGSEEDQKEQFQYQLQQMYILLSNAINGTVNDESFFLFERQDDYFWISGKRIWTITLPTTAWTAGGTVNTIPLTIVPLTNNLLTIIKMEGVLSNGATFTSNTLPLPYLDVTVAANSIQLERVSGNIVLTSGGTDYSAYSGYITVYYTKS